ncbi:MULTISPECIES: EF0163 family protein [unclassified Lactococcus]|uniref:EF0163 family protein n=1 Tax=unclassified Lactococcus TaxID=2643510 RepID=UPI00257FBBA7|nr:MULTISPECIES: EF0163 family protein [unclassified Lactococcus]
MKSKKISKKTLIISAIAILFVGVALTISLASQQPTEPKEMVETDFVIKDSSKPKKSETSAVEEENTVAEEESNMNLDSPENLEKLSFVEDFLKTYCNYKSIDDRNQNIKDMLTPEMQKYMSVDVSVPVTMKSESDSIEIYQDAQGNFVGLVKQTIAKRPQLQVYKLQLKKTATSYLVSQFSSPTAD